MCLPFKTTSQAADLKSSFKSKIFEFFPTVYDNRSNSNELFTVVPRELVLIPFLEEVGLGDYFFLNYSGTKIDKSFGTMPIPKNILNVFLLNRRNVSLPHDWYKLSDFMNLVMPFGHSSMVDLFEMFLIVPTKQILNKTILQEETVALKSLPFHESLKEIERPFLVTLLEYSPESKSKSSSQGTPISNADSFLDVLAKEMIDNGDYERLLKAIFCDFPFFCIEIPDRKYLRMSSPWSINSTYSQFQQIQKSMRMFESWKTLKKWFKNNILESFEKDGLYLPLRIIQESINDTIPRSRKFSQIIFGPNANSIYNYFTSKGKLKIRNSLQHESTLEKRAPVKEDQPCIPITWYNIFHHSIFGNTRFCSATLSS